VLAAASFLRRSAGNQARESDFTSAAEHEIHTAICSAAESLLDLVALTAKRLTRQIFKTLPRQLAN
jgi:hypothetical protein